MFMKIKTWTGNLKRQIFILYFACKDERVPWYAKVFTACVVAYAFSPIDLIPDFIPILGYLDDVILVPLGIIIALKMIPKSVLTECESKAEEMMKNDKQKYWIVGSIIVLIIFQGSY
ncbi:YkvA family protein [Peribacillus sp. NPDC055009]